MYGRSKSAHLFWEFAGVILGIYLIIIALTILKDNTITKTIHIIAGITSIIVDGFFFIPSFLSNN